jgi:hypothetical protein
LRGSGGVGVAAAAGLSLEIVASARTIEAQRENERIALGKPTPPSVDSKIRVSREAPGWLDDLGIQKSEYRSQERNLGPALAVFGVHSPMVGVRWNRGDDEWGGARMLPPYGARFIDKLVCQPSEEVRRAEGVLLRELASTQDETLKSLTTALFAARELRTVLALDVVEPGEPNRESLERYRRFVRSLNGMRQEGGGLIGSVRNLSAAIAPYAEQLSRAGLHPEVLRETEASIASLEAILVQRADFPPRESEAVKGVSWDVWRSWCRVCRSARTEFNQLDSLLSELNFFVTVASTIQSQKWAPVQELNQPGEMIVEGGLNTLLAAELGKSAVTPNDILLGASSSYILSGTNGGGKTQFMELLALTAILACRIEHVPAEKASIGAVPYFDIVLHGGEHQDDRSSFQDEVRRIQAMIQRFENAGAPAGSILMIDEPFKGTSEEDAIPLLIGLMKYAEARGAKLIFTTHFSGIYSVLDKLDEGSRLSWSPLSVDYFSTTERFKVRNGIGESSGIAVAEHEGIPVEIIEAAHNAKGVLFPQG